MAPRSMFGIWVGTHEQIIENVVAVGSGKNVRVRAVLRRFDAEQWDVEHASRVKSTPNCPDPGSLDDNITILKPDESDQHVCGNDFFDARMLPSNTKRRNAKLTQIAFEEHRYTDGCIGCEALQSGVTRRSHSTYCRSTIVEKFNTLDEGRAMLRCAEQRRNDFHDATGDPICHKILHEKTQDEADGETSSDPAIEEE